jgi:hypothetical protein
LRFLDKQPTDILKLHSRFVQDENSQELDRRETELERLLAEHDMLENDPTVDSISVEQFEAVKAVALETTSNAPVDWNDTPSTSGTSSYNKNNF